MKTRRLLLIIALASASAEPLVFPPGATFEQKKQMIREHMRAEQMEQALGAQQANIERGIREEAARRDALIASTIIPATIKEAETDAPSFFDKCLVIDGTINVSSYYNWAFQGQEEHLLSFEIRDVTGRAYGYMTRGEEASKTRRKIIAAGGPVSGKFFLGFTKEIYTSGQGEVLGFLVRSDFKIDEK